MLSMFISHLQDCCGQPFTDWPSLATQLLDYSMRSEVGAHRRLALRQNKKIRPKRKTRKTTAREDIILCKWVKRTKMADMW